MNFTRRRRGREWEEQDKFGDRKRDIKKIKVEEKEEEKKKKR